MSSAPAPALQPRPLSASSDLCASVASFPPPSTLALFLFSPLPLLHRLKAELEEFRGQVPVQTQSTPEDLADKKGRSGARDGGQAGREGDRTSGDVPGVPQREGLWGAGHPRGLTVTGQRQLRVRQPDSRLWQARPKLLGTRLEDDGEPPVELALTPRKASRTLPVPI